jgi:hypothetical protein
MDTTPANASRLAQAALDSDLDTLYAVIGRALEQETLGVAPMDRQRLAAAGRNWMKEKSSELKRFICGQPAVQKFFSGPVPVGADGISAVLLLTDLIVTVCHGVPATCVSTLILKLGLKKFCGQQVHGDDRQ